MPLQPHGFVTLCRSIPVDTLCESFGRPTQLNDSTMPRFLHRSQAGKWLSYTALSTLFSASFAAIGIVLWRRGGIQHTELAVAGVASIRSNTAANALRRRPAIS
jgi:hypothetical protein